MARRKSQGNLSGIGFSFQLLAERLGVHPSQVTRWNAVRVPAGRVLAVELLTGVPRERLRPDLYPPKEQGHERAY